jgi:hypothetical protein
MIRPKPFLIIALIFAMPFLSIGLQNPVACDLQISSTVTVEQDQTAKIEVTVKGGSAPYTYIFYKESGHLVSTEFTRNWVSGLAKGKYSCTVADKNNCKGTIEIEIK